MKLVKYRAPVLSIPYGFPLRRNGRSKAAVGNFISQNKLEAKGKNNIIKILNGTRYNLINKLQSTSITQVHMCLPVLPHHQESEKWNTCYALSS